MNDRDALAAKYFPREWASVATALGKSKQRTKLRQRAEAAQKIEALAAAGCNCGNCGSFSVTHAWGDSRTYCGMDSDFHGYALVQPNELCSRWYAKVAQATDPSQVK